MSLTPSDLERTASTPLHWLPGYEILSLIGSGGFGDVYEARQLKLNRIVAVKVVDLGRAADPTLAVRFETEAFSLGRFHHPNIVPVYDYGRQDGRLYLAMELLEGEDLGARLGRGGPLDERTAWLIARQAAAGLAHAAGLGVVHRDVKPANLFLVPAPVGGGLPPDVPMVKVTDFGLARAVWAVDPSEGPRTRPGVSLGTPAYMAPEQHRGDDVDHRADIYALGATVCHALSGKPPFDGHTVWAVMARKLDNAPKTPPGCSRESSQLLSAMLAADRDKRIGSYEELIARIDRLPAVRGAVVSARAPRRAVPWRRVALVAGASLLATAGVLGGRAVWHWHEASQPSARYVSGGEQIHLFDRSSLQKWGTVDDAGGGRWMTIDEEKTPVFELTGFTRREFDRFDDYRLIVAVDPYKASAFEVHFAIPAPNPNTGKRLVIRIEKDGLAMLGSRVGDKGDFRPNGPGIKVPSAERVEIGNRYLEVMMDRAGGYWSGQFLQRPLGRVKDDGVRKLTELRLFAEDGPARVDTVGIEQLRPASD